MSLMEVALKAAFVGPEQKKLKLYGHEFNIKPMEITKFKGGVIKGIGRISHHLSKLPDDQIDYIITVKGDQIISIKTELETGGLGGVFEDLLPLIDILLEQFEINIGDTESYKDLLVLIENTKNGSWQRAVSKVLQVFAVKIASGMSIDQTSDALKAKPKTAKSFKVYGDIAHKYNALGGPKGFLGKPLTDETGTPDGVGRFNHFEHGSIYWTSKTGAFEVHGSIREKWKSLGWEKSKLGYPVSDEQDLPGGGKVSKFQNGRLCWRADKGVWVE
ncbi:MAG: hypothetical protein V4709_04125 [Pseudomonadota bacterium]